MEKGLTQRQLGRIMGYQSESSLSHLECGRKLPSFATAVKLEAALQQPIRFIYSGAFDEIWESVAKRRVAFAEKRVSAPRS